MEDSRNERLQQLLRKLGKAVHESVVDSDEIRSCLEELHEEGWNAVMMLEASLACGPDGTLESQSAKLRLHVDDELDGAQPTYQIDVADARLLAALGIAPGRHRSRNVSAHLQRVKRDHDDESP